MRTTVDLYDDDGNHATAAGSYVAAVQITETILGRELTVGPKLAGLDAEVTAAILAFG